MTKMGSSVSAPRMGSFILVCLTHKVGQGERGFHSFVWSGTTTPACAGPPAEAATEHGDGAAEAEVGPSLASHTPAC